MKKQISIILIMILILSSCANKKQITKSSIETNTIEQIDSISKINTSSNTTTETNDSTEIIIQELIEETITDTLNNQTTKRTTKRKTTIMKSGNTKIEQKEETDTTHNKHKQIKEKKKENNKSTTSIKHYQVRRYLFMIICMIVAILIYKFTRNGKK